MDACPSFRRRCCDAAAWIAAVLCLSVALPAAAGDSARYATSQQPHWKVGDPDRTLSDACRRGRFNQIADMQHYITYLGERGSGVTGIARKAWNLRDPGGLAVPEATYHFADDGLSTCRVYVSKEKNPAGR